MQNMYAQYKFVLQATVNNIDLVNDVANGCHGKVHDAEILTNSDTYELGYTNRLYKSNQKLHAGHQVNSSRMFYWHTVLQ